MLLVTQLVGFGAGQQGYGSLTQITDYTGSSNIGDLTSGGGLAAAWNGSIEVNTGSARNTGSGTHYIGKGWASAKRIGQIKVFAPSNENGGAAHELRLYGKNSSPANATDGTQLFTTPSNDVPSNSSLEYTTGFDTSAAYTYHWLTWVSTSFGVQVAEVQLWAYES